MYTWPATDVTLNDAYYPLKVPLKVYTGHCLATPFFLTKLLERASEIDNAIEGFSATIITTQGVFIFSVLNP